MVSHGLVSRLAFNSCNVISFIILNFLVLGCGIEYILAEP